MNVDRLTIPDEPIEGGMRRAVVDARAVKEQAMTLYWKLKKYEDTGLEPDEIKELKEKSMVQKMHKPNPNIYCCPGCREKIMPMWDCCPWCGQHVTDNQY